MTTLIAQMVQMFAPWQTIFDNSKAVSGTVAGVHILALLFGGGLAIAADRSTLRLTRERSADDGRTLSELHAVHRPVLVALGLLFASGVLLAAADIETFASSPVFWIKLGLVTLLLVNGALLTRTESALRRAPSTAGNTGVLWMRLRRRAIYSIALWTTTAIAGVVLVNAA